MKNLKILATVVLTTILTITMGVSVFASDRAAIFEDEVIKMPSSLTNGKGTVSTSTLSGATLSFQFVMDGITAERIAKIERYEAEIAIAKAYNYYTKNAIDSTDHSDPNYAKYESLLNAYRTKYCGGAEEVIFQDGTRTSSSSAYVEANIDKWYSYIETEYGTRGENWTTSTDGKTVELDLSTFTGTHYVVLWARYTKNGANQYRPQWYKVTGTKTEEPDPENPETPEEPTESEKTNGNTPKTITTGKSDGSSTASTIPYTGAKSIIGLIVAAGTLATVSYIRYRRIK